MSYDPTAYAIREAQRKAAATVLQQKYPMLVKADGNALVAAAKNRDLYT